MEKKESLKVYALIEHEKPKTDNFGHIRVIFVHLENGSPRNFSHGDEPLNGVWFNDLEISCQYNVDREVEPYAWELVYKPYQVDLRDAEKMVKTFKVYSARVKKIESEWGPAMNYPNFVLRTCKALGVSGALQETRNGHGWSYNDNDYREMALTEIVFVIQQEIDEARKLYRLAA